MFPKRISAVGLGSFLFMTSSQRNFGPSSSTQGIDAVIYVKLNSRICSLVLMHNQFDLRPRWPLGEEYSQGKCEAHSLKRARIHP
ncbi:uncharacterized protein LOC103708673 isoform X3 [Phoenix dactylifera]|uniref:Uncharacterized protein LOC103708673 isoform X3 n=1 Tax=Phoenix dactylifera TaxID=42345 RepID=A0A8B9A7I4_PHODC|nr:uncharacterized protein LOC103708673 isoform X3 [Phoenix dactylifera]